MSSFDPTLLGIFEAEQREHIERIRALAAHAEEPLARPALEEVLRRAHTLKGAAHAVGLAGIERLTQRLEALFVKLRDGALAYEPAVRATVVAMLDAAEDATAAVLARGDEPDVSEALRPVEALLGITPAPGPAPPPGGRREAPPSAPQAPDTVRVGAANVDRLVASSSQLLAAAAVQMGAARELDGLLRRVEEFERDWARLRGGLSARHRPNEPEDAPLAESFRRLGGELRELVRGVRAAAGEHQRHAWTLNRLAAEVYDGSCRVRMTPAETVFGMFRKMVRELAVEAGKQVDFRLDGMDVQADRLVLQALKDPVMHLLRNAVAHGIEPPGERAAAGKPETGMVRLSVESPGDRLKITVTDDGRGIDLARVREAAVKRGLLSPGDEAARELDRLAKLLMTPGFSTSAEVGKLSGLGMGLSVVEQQVSRVQGRVEFRISGGQGLAVEISAPLAISLDHVLLVASGGHRYAFPSAGIDRLCRVPLKKVESVEGADVLRIDGTPVPLANLGELVGLPGPGDGARTPSAEDGREPVLSVAVLKAGEFRAAAVVDALLDERQAVVKDLGLPPDLAGLSMGGVPLEDGTVAVVLNPAAVLDRLRSAAKRFVLKKPPEKPEAPATILVVDDSITTRSLEKSILEAHGYRVRLAVDGVEALAQLRAERADLVIADVNMPRMNGFELLEQMKKDNRLAEIPVIMVTSLEDREDQERGLSLGADAYIVKRKFDQKELLETVRQML